MRRFMTSGFAALRGAATGVADADGFATLRAALEDATLRVDTGLAARIAGAGFAARRVAVGDDAALRVPAEAAARRVAVGVAV